MKKFAAHFVFPVSSAPLAKGIVEVDSSGKITQLIVPHRNLEEMAGMEFHNGIICPGFVNLFDEFSLPKFFSLFPELKEYESLFPEHHSGDRGILEWMKAIQLKDAKLSLTHLIRLFTLESAKAIDLQNELGSLEPGKQPGLLLIYNMDYQKLQLTENSRLKRLI